MTTPFAAFLAGFSELPRDGQEGFSRPIARAGFFSSSRAFGPWFARAGNGAGFLFRAAVVMTTVYFFNRRVSFRAVPHFTEAHG
jgi:hypothetical protein